MKEIIKDLQKAYEQKQCEEQVSCFIQLGDYYFQDEQHPIYAIACYNFALGICQDVNKKLISSNHINNIRKKIDAVANDFVKSIGGVSARFTDLSIEQKEDLEKIRKESWEILESSNPSIEKIHEDISKSIKIFFKRLIEQCQLICPCPAEYKDYAIICLGSLARNEATPYSDLEFAVLIKEEVPGIKEYFKNLTKLIFIMILNLGETTPRIMHIESLDWIDDVNSPTVKGLSFDGQMRGGCKTPIGNIHLNLPSEQSFELIGTPSEIAVLHNEENYKKDRHLSTVLGAVSFVSGKNEELVKLYEDKVKEVMERKIIWKGESLTFAQKRALLLLPEISAKFEPRGGLNQREGHHFDVKYDLYRLPQMVIGHLALYFGVNGNSTWSQIRSLEEFFNQESISHLNKIISDIAALRLGNYLTNRGRNRPLEIIRSNSEYIHNRYCTISVGGSLFKFYYVLMPMYEALVKFVNENEIDSINQRKKL